LSEEILVGLASIIILGILAQWLAWRLHLPSILLLLIFGFLAGPITGTIHPDEVFGELLFPLVSISVAVILFEGGLSLRLSELKKGGRIIRNLTTIGVLITWVLTSGAAYLVLGIEFWPAVLLGAILVVSGPTVIIPLLRQVRPKGNIGSIVKWEGIVNDPIGAILAVLVFEVIVHGGMGKGTGLVIFGAAKALFFGGLFGFLGAGIIVILLKRYLIPDFLQNAVALMIVVMSFAAANMLQMESGLLAVTIMGVALANQKYVSIKHIYEFKETLRVILISSLFIILAARVPLEQVALDKPIGWVFVALLIVVVRPLMVLGSTLRSGLNIRERIFLAWMAPRGIVAAAVVSVFAIRLADVGFAGFERLVPITFQVIIGTVAVYGLSAPYVARRLKVAQANPQGILFAGAQSWVQSIAEVLKTEGFRIVLVDTNWANITAARKKGCNAYYANILSENLFYDLQLDGVGRIMAMTRNDEVNSLAALHFNDIFDKSELYQLSPSSKSQSEQRGLMPKHLRGRYLFGKEANYIYLENRFTTGAIVKKTDITTEFYFEDFKKIYGDSVLPLFIIREGGRLKVCTDEEEIIPKPGETLISLVDPVAENGNKKPASE
jgi:NhaP-type Na+/H+ or K+/H+ antiporter